MISLLGEVWSGETQQQPAALDPLSDCRFFRRGIGPCVRENQDGKLTLQQIRSTTATNLAEWTERPLDVVVLPEQGLCFGVRRSDDPNWAPPPPLIDQQYRARGLIAFDFNTGNPVSELARQRQPHIGSLRSWLDRRALTSEQAPILSAGTHLIEPATLFDEISCELLFTAASGDPVAEPDRGICVRQGQFFEANQRRAPVDEPRLRLQRLDRGPSICGPHRRQSG